MAKIKKYTIEDTIPDGAVFIFKESEISKSVTDNNSTGGYYPTMEYFYFLVPDEEEEPTHLLLKCVKCGHDQLNKI